MRILKGLFFLVVATLSQKAFAETIQLKDGSIIKGSIATMDEQVVVVDTADMGRLTIKRRTIQSIKDGADHPSGAKGDAPQNVNININNQQTNDQKNNQKNDQKNEQKIEQSVKVEQQKKEDRKAKERLWEQGIFGRLLMGTQRVRITGAPESNPSLNTENKSSFGMMWDLVGFRSASWWSVSLFMNGGTVDKPLRDTNQTTSTGTKLPRTDLTNVGVRLDTNIFQVNHRQKALSQFYIGPSIASQNLTVKPDGVENVENFTFKASGTRLGLDAGYEYLVGENFGLAVGLSVGQAELSTFEFGNKALLEGYLPVNFDKKKMKVANSIFTVGVLWNIDI